MQTLSEGMLVLKEHKHKLHLLRICFHLLINSERNTSTEDFIIPLIPRPRPPARYV